MLTIILSIPIIILLLLSYYLPPLRILQILILFVSISEPYISAIIMFILTPIIYYKLFKKKALILSELNKSFLFLSLIWIGYSAITILWVNDFNRFFSEFLQLILLLLLSYALIISIKTWNDIKTTNYYLIGCGIIITIKSILDTFSQEFVPINYYAFISLVTCIALPLAFFNLKSLKNTILTICCLFIAFLCILINESRANTLLGFLLIAVRLIFLNSLKKSTRFLIVSSCLIVIPILLLWYYNMNDDNILKSVLDVERNYSNLERLALLGQSVDVFIQNKFGVGFGSTNSVFMSTASYTDFSYPHPHLTLAHLAVELGLIGIFIYFLLFLFHPIQVIYNFKSTTLGKNEEGYLYKFLINLFIVLLLFSFLDDMFFNGMFNFYCMIFLSYFFAVDNFRRRSLNAINAK